LIVLDFLGFEFVEMGVKVCEFIREDIGVWNYVEFFFAETLLHLNYVEAESIFSG